MLPGGECVKSPMPMDSPVPKPEEWAMTSLRRPRRSKPVFHRGRSAVSLRRASGRRLLVEPLEDRRLLAVGVQLAAGIHPTPSPAAVPTIAAAAIGPELSGVSVTPDPVQTVAKLLATASDANAGNYNIVAAEYFIDGAGENGRGKPMTAVDKKFNSSSEAIGAKLDPILAKLGQGPHTIFLHAEDSSGTWGPWATVTFTKDTLGPVTSSVSVAAWGPSAPPTVTAMVDDSSTGQSNVATAEFFIDKLGKNGKGTPMTGAFNSPTQWVTATVSDAVFNALSQGKHTLYVHGEDGLGQWGHVASVAFSKDTLGPAADALKALPKLAKNPPTVTATIDDTRAGDSNIVAAEYFIDAEGRTGAGLPMTASGGQFSGPKVDVTATIDAGRFALLSAGKHTIYVHGEDVWGYWGPFASIAFKKAPAAALPPAAGSSATTTTALQSKINDAAILAIAMDSTNRGSGTHGGVPGPAVVDMFKE